MSPLARKRIKNVFKRVGLVPKSDEIAHVFSSTELTRFKKRSCRTTMMKISGISWLVVDFLTVSEITGWSIVSEVTLAFDLFHRSRLTIYLA